MEFDLILLQEHLTKIREYVPVDEPTEKAAHILCGLADIGSDPWTKKARLRAISSDVIRLSELENLSSSDAHITWDTSASIRVMKRAKEDGLVLGIVHSHPSGPNQFSEQDDFSERELIRTAQNRNGSNAKLVSLLLTGDGQLLARLWVDPLKPIPASKITIVGSRLEIHGGDVISDEFLDRQARAFGSALNTKLRGLRVGIVGCGATGSATATLLARMGVGHLALFDADRVETTNLNRLHGARRSDADALALKVEVLKREITGWALGVKVVSFDKWASDPECRDALRSCDVIFGCTDDNDGRSFLNRVPYFYGIPVIDMGLAIEPRKNGGFSELSGRVTVLAPGGACLHCHGVIDPAKAREEDLSRRFPKEYERQKREAYVRGLGDPAPAVVTFTTATACLAVDEFIQGITDFRKTGSWSWQRTRRFDVLADRRPGPETNLDCPICVDRTYWGRGDVEPFLDRVG